MNDKELEKPENWDFEHAEKRPPIPGSRAVVSVAFAREDFDRLAEHAQRLGLRTSEFIRTAALERVRGGVSQAHFVLVIKNRREQVYLDAPPPETGIELEEPKAWRTDPHELVATG